MTESTGKRAVIINNIRSDSIEQAIFILKPTAEMSTSVGTGIVAEAQEIINNYIMQVERAGSYSNSKKRAFKTGIAIAAAIAVLSAIVIFLILK